MMKIAKVEITSNQQDLTESLLHFLSIAMSFDELYNYSSFL